MSMEKKIVECVPNFSEGRNMAIIKQITDEIERVKGVKLLDVDPGEATNRTVVTFVGEPDAVLEAAFLAVGKAGQLIDMRNHHGAHPRMGATDVCPLIPVAGITLEECAELAHKLQRNGFVGSRHGEHEVNVRMNELLNARIAAIQFLQEMQDQGESASAVVFVQQHGMRNVPACHHLVQRIDHFRISIDLHATTLYRLHNA